MKFQQWGIALVCFKQGVLAPPRGYQPPQRGMTKKITIKSNHHQNHHGQQIKVYEKTTKNKNRTLKIQSVNNFQPIHKIVARHLINTYLYGNSKNCISENNAKISKHKSRKLDIKTYIFYT